MLVFMAALRRELGPLEALVQVRHRARIRGCSITQGSVGGLSVALVQSGVGGNRAQEGARAVMESCRPEAIISIGFAGGVSPDVRAGDLILGERVYPWDPQAIGENGDSVPKDCLSADSALLEAAALTLQEEQIPCHKGDVLTVPEVLGPMLKKWVGARSPVKAVDMESYWIGEAAMANSVPFLAVRAVSDEVGDTLPEYQQFLDEMGELQPLNAALYFLTHPQHLVAAPRQAGRTRRASENLGAFADLFFSKICGAIPERNHERRAGS